MIGLFVHDHRFPRKGNKYYYSYGFDEEFFKRYSSIFGNIEIIGRETPIENNQISLENEVDKEIKFTTIKKLKDLKNKTIRSQIKEKIYNSDYIVIRLPSMLGLFAVKWAKKYSKPYLIEVVGCAWDAISTKGIKKVPYALVISKIIKGVIRKANYVVYVTEEFLQKRYPTNGKSIACSNVNLKDVKQEDLLARNKAIENKDIKKKLILGTCATIDVIYKGQADVIKAISKLKIEGYHIEYQLVGGGDKSYLTEVAIKYGVKDQIVFLGKLKHENVFKWLETIDIYIHPSRTEGLSRAIIEAMSKACPVIASDVGGIKEQINGDLIYEKGNVEQICKIIRQTDNSIMKENATKNYENSQKYLADILTKRRIDFFNQFIEGK